MDREEQQPSTQHQQQSSGSEHEGVRREIEIAEFLARHCSTTHLSNQTNLVGGVTTTPLTAAATLDATAALVLSQHTISNTGPGGSETALQSLPWAISALSSDATMRGQMAANTTASHFGQGVDSMEVGINSGAGREVLAQQLRALQQLQLLAQHQQRQQEEQSERQKVQNTLLQLLRSQTQEQGSTLAAAAAQSPASAFTLRSIPSTTQPEIPQQQNNCSVVGAGDVTAILPPSPSELLNSQILLLLRNARAQHQQQSNHVSPTGIRGETASGVAKLSTAGQLDEVGGGRPACSILAADSSSKGAGAATTSAGRGRSHTIANVTGGIQQPAVVGMVAAKNVDLTAIHHPPHSSESCHIITRFLMQYNLSADLEFSKKAIESLIKRLRDRRDELDVFIGIVHAHRSREATGQTQVPDDSLSPSQCVTIPRTLDGRLQVAGRKGFPHVVYARIFRWPDLHKNEIRHRNGVCQTGFDLKTDCVCINPYHYHRVSVAAVISSGGSGTAGRSPPLLTPLRHLSTCSSATTSDQREPTSSGSVGGGRWSLPPAASKRHNSLNVEDCLNMDGSSGADDDDDDDVICVSETAVGGQSTLLDEFCETLRLELGSVVDGSAAIGIKAAVIQGAGRETNELASLLKRFPCSISVLMRLLSSAATDPPTATTTSPPAQAKRRLSFINNCGSSSENVISRLVQVMERSPHIAVSPQRWLVEPLLRLLKSGEGQECVVRKLIDALIENIHQRGHEKRRLFLAEVNDVVNGRGGDAKSSAVGVFSLTYHEFDCSGDSLPSHRTTYIHCGAAPPPDGKEHFAVGVGKLAGRLTPLQAQQVVDARKVIGMGVALEWSAEGEVYLRCLARRPVYVSSQFLDREAMRTAGECTHVIYQQARIQVHDLFQCTQQLKMWRNERGVGQCLDDKERQKLLREIDSLCRVRLSFGVEFGTEQRPRIEQTPCWMEVRMERTKLLLEKMLLSEEHSDED